ncbi:MAG TPA: EamA family transporter [Luteibacter sp.]|jgi:drug/metabolite transporter (DMT)-like permease|uniref:EamA family transporter n=1 Tax=Luteibacter sp. TaxID=1886636 RepID=UPI002F3E68BA
MTKGNIMRPVHVLLGVLVTLIWGSNFSVIEVGLGALDPFVLTTLRFVFTAMPLVFFVRKPGGVPMWAMAAYGILFGAGLWGVVNIAMAQGMSPGLSSLILQFAAFITVILSAALSWHRRIRSGTALPPSRRCITKKKPPEGAGGDLGSFARWRGWERPRALSSFSSYLKREVVLG